MKFRHYLVSALMAITATAAVDAQQPYGGCWHPDDIKDWSPETDPDAKFNRSRVPLAERFKEPQLMKANANQYYEGQVCNATILFNVCSMCPSQGANNFLGYQPTYWQYMDKLVYWAGSASEGIIIPPPAPSVDAAHAQGVKVLGQIFFPPSAFGGTQAWVRQMVTKENGRYIYAIKLYEIAKYLGFDGWFINEETGGASSADWVGFINEFNSAADANGDTHMEIQWYNASTSPNIAILKTHKNTSQFLEYGVVGDKRSYASVIGCTEEETFSKIYAGIQCVNGGLTGWNSSINSAFPTTGHVGSIDLFCPEERVWKDNVKDLLGTPDDNGSEAYAATNRTFNNEQTMWVNNAGDPSDISNTRWRGLSGAVLERSVITSLPFVSDMNVGVGKHRFVEGDIKGTQDWYHSGMQSVLPTWRWWIENRGGISVAIDWDNAYNGASSFKFTNITAGEHLVRLYKTMIPVSGAATAQLVYKGTAAPALKLSTSSSVNPDMTVNARNTVTKNGWNVAEYDLSGLDGKTLYMLGIDLNGIGSSFSLARVALLPAGYSPAGVEVRNLKQESNLGEEFGDIRVSWDFDWSNDFDHFDIYVEDLSGNSKLVGQTRGEGFYIPRVDRNENDEYIKVSVVPVMKNGTQLPTSSVNAAYPAPSTPVVSFKLSRSYIKVGETVTVTAKGTGKPTAWKWTLPDGLQLVEGSLTDNVIKVKGVKVGNQMVSVQATNEIGTSTTEVNLIDVLNESDYNGIYNVVLKKTVVDYSGSTNAVEVPDKIIDGITRPISTSMKWCNVSPDNWVIFDCEGVYRFYGFKIYDCNSGPETAENIRDYTIELSQDGVNWTTVVNEYNCTGINVKEDYIVPTKGRYIRFSPKVGGTLRVWEFEAYGVDNVNFTIKADPEMLRLNTGETEEITLSYSLNGDSRENNFDCTATASNSGVTIGEITEDTAAGTFTIPVTGSDMIGESRIVIRLQNGGAYKEAVVSVTIDSDSQPNVLGNMAAIVRHYKADYSYEAQYEEYNIAGLTDGNLTEEALLDIETPSTHKQDLWAIFTAPEGTLWNLSKVKVYLPDENYGENDNGKQGYVNNEIAIAVGNDLHSLTTVKTFSNIERVSELEYILPEYSATKYVAIICTLNPYFYPSMAEVEAFEQIEGAIPAVGPVNITTWPHDIIAESKPSANHTNYTLDDQDWVLFSTDIQERGAIAGNDRMVTTSNGTEFRMAPYDGNNAAVIKSVGTEHNLEFDAPAQCDEIQLLTISANGQSTLKVYANYEDGTKSDAWTFNPQDWFGSESGTAVYGLSRIITQTHGYEYTADQVDTRYQFRLYEHAFRPDPAKKVKSISVSSAKAGSYPTVLAVSKVGKTSAIGDVTADTDRSPRAIKAIYNLQGIEVKNPDNGIYIIRYTDGTAEKVLIK